MKTPSQHTDKDGFVLLVKCLNRDGTGHNNFKWPEAGPVQNHFWSRKADCDSGGLFGWPWGFGMDGREPDACATWLVFRAKPENVIDLSGKAKAVPSDDGKELPEVVFYGTQAGAMAFTMAGRMELVAANASGSASQTGDRGSASQTGDKGSASQTGYRGSASQTGYRGSASQTGDNGSASQTGDSGSASQTGERGSAEVHGDESVSVCLGLNAKAKGKKGCWLTLDEWKEIDGKLHRIDVQTKKVDGERIRADTWYTLKYGSFAEV